MTKNFLALATAVVALAAPQQFQLNLDDLAAKAANAVDLSLSGSTLRFAARFLDGHDPDEAQIRKLIEGLQGIYIKHFEFKHDGEWTQADLDRVRKQLHAPEWDRIVGVKSSEEGSAAELYLHVENGKNTGIAILEAESRELTVVNIVGTVDLEALADLGGHFNIPKLTIPKEKKSK
jgi:Domain of unknown function (DUF4252)